MLTEGIFNLSCYKIIFGARPIYSEVSLVKQELNVTFYLEETSDTVYSNYAIQMSRRRCAFREEPPLPHADVCLWRWKQ